MIVRLRWLCLAALAGFTALAAFGGEPARWPGFLRNGVTAHRGNSSEFPENTLPAFRSAIQLGADWIELDVFRTRDGRLVVIHDRQTGRVGDTCLVVPDSTYAELLTVDVAALYRRQRGKTLAECPAERIPLLEDVLQLVTSQRKTRASLQPKMDCVGDAVALVKKHGAEAWVGFNDGNLASMAEVKRLAPQIAVFWDRHVADVDRDIGIARHHGFEALVLRKDTVTAESIAAIKRAGLEAGAWTANDREIMRCLLAAGVDRLYTDFPATLLALRAGRGAPRPPQVGWVQAGVLAAPEAVQGAAAEGRFVYAIANAQVAKYERSSGKRVAASTGPAKHLNSGFFWKGRLYCAHSNFPRTPPHSEIKVLDPESMQLGTLKDFGDFGGSLTWAVRQGAHWWCNFAHYGADNAKTLLVAFDDQWREQGRWHYPPELIGCLGRASLSGGLWRDGFLLATDHDHRVVYRLRVPRQGGLLELVDTCPSPIPGQGIAEDPLTGGLLGIDRAKRQVVFARPRKTVRLLTIGNSFSRNATRWLADLAAAAGHELVHHQAAIGGGSLAQHWEKALQYDKDPGDKRATYGALSLNQELLAEQWNFVSIQQRSAISHELATYWPYARNLRDRVAALAPQAEILVHQTWAYRCDDPRFTTKAAPGEPATQKAMYEGLTRSYEAIAAELGLRVIPVGRAFYQADNDPSWGYRHDPAFDPGTAVFPALPDQTHSLHVGWRWSKPARGKPRLRMDGHHAGLAGEYLGACVFYETLFGQSVVDVPFVPQGLDPVYARFLRATAHRAVEESQPWRACCNGASGRAS